MPTLLDECYDRETECRTVPRHFNCRSLTKGDWLRVLATMEQRRIRGWYIDCHCYIGSYQEASDELQEAVEELMRHLRNTKPTSWVWQGLNWTVDKLAWFIGLYGFKV